MNDPVARVGAFDVGGTHIRGVLVDTAGWRPVPGTAAERSLPADGAAPVLLDRIADCVRAVVGAASVASFGDKSTASVASFGDKSTASVASFGDKPAASVASFGDKSTASVPVSIAVPAPFDYAKGVALYHGVAKFDALNGVDVGAALRARLGMGPIGFTPDAEAFLRGEAIAGAAAGHARAVGITLGTGVGSAFLADGVMVDDGPLVPPEGRIDLTTVDGAPLEDTVSRRALLRAWGGTRDVSDLARLARDGSPAEAKVLRHAFHALGRAFAPWVAGFRPTVLVVGGGMSGAWDLVEPPLADGLTDGGVTALPALVRARSAHDAPLLGAAWHASRARA